MLDPTSWTVSSRPLLWRRGGGVPPERERGADWPPAFGLLSGVKADMEELSAVGEQVFDAECILNKRLRKVRTGGCAHTFICSSRGGFRTNFLSRFCSCVSGKVGVPGEVEGMVIQVSASGAETMKTTTAARSSVRVEPELNVYARSLSKWRTRNHERGLFVRLFFSSICVFIRLLLFTTPRFCW